ncbi:DUF2256 domain-containing protein [Chroogloeocystis siderophila 5.2 s.c.1]|uniref:DUF2256 domain-containing protein n=1 Tax=Chroogloeocystis siderophila 5.2 s.c.1 TaxID=247279 RepID=A0A1U7HP14_9CHRO|nr:DUF2256 domain-containing protein [Chroogloeocystis siderophila 5.2 s.c.1]
MARARAKSDLPTKICPVCQRPFTWRKKWADCWDDVKYCSERCRRRRSNTDKYGNGIGRKSIYHLPITKPHS